MEKNKGSFFSGNRDKKNKAKGLPIEERIITNDSVVVNEGTNKRSSLIHLQCGNNLRVVQLEDLQRWEKKVGKLNLCAGSKCESRVYAESAKRFGVWSILWMMKRVNKIGNATQGRW